MLIRNVIQTSERVRLVFGTRKLLHKELDQQ